jgi:ectoine hydroxylase-related dioxygenase (phytanoyl-CoA dioxygenase family)
MTRSIFYEQSHCDITKFFSHIQQILRPKDVPHASEIQSNVPIYEASSLLSDLSCSSSGAGRKSILEEWANVLDNGPGVLVLTGLVSKIDVIDEASAAFNDIIIQEKQASLGQGDHFATTGSNTRIWNSTQKLCLAYPELFGRYFGNTILSSICEAWLGPGYQMTSQVNVVHPGGKPQIAHRDYHLGFQSSEVLQQYASHIHALSPALTLQGAIAHCDMPLESGPTKLLPYSQSFEAGYLAVRNADFRDVFEQHCIQLPLKKGDGLFFNPALFHAAGANKTKAMDRMANLIQVSSAFGRSLESLDRVAMSLALYPSLLKLRKHMNTDQLQAAIASCAEGYSFPTNLDTDPPINGNAPESQAELMRCALKENLSLAKFKEMLQQQTNRRQALT